ncbi:hypothetical protein RY27_17780 [Litorilinea aerophila]|nr:hypothetical protein RY27_17780 [Litorilinea aerophila]
MLGVTEDGFMASWKLAETAVFLGTWRALASGVVESRVGTKWGTGSGAAVTRWGDRVTVSPVTRAMSRPRPNAHAQTGAINLLGFVMWISLVS